MIGLALTALLAAAPLASSAPSFANGQFGHLASVRRSQEGDMSLYRGPKRCMEDCVEGLLQRMTLEEKAGQMFHTPLLMLPGGDLAGGNDDARLTATFVNRAQELALHTRLGALTTISTEPRHSFTENVGTGFKAGVVLGVA
ncbi:hypothetical protein DL769_005044 [Monosporascus sp. CRB-8-3]|nr:hypothetical protein DL769_005044 [Monosporascus sp. CRB-8-3]